MKKRIAITGGSGHIGNVVCRVLLQQGYTVRALVHQDARSLQGLELECIHGDILNPDALDQLMQGCSVVIHCAARISIHGDPDGQVFRTNTEGPRHLLDAARRNGIRRILHLSSVHAVMEIPLDEPFDERRPYKNEQAFAYDHSKAVGEQIMLQAAASGDIDIIILRPSAVIGPFDFKPSELGKALLDFYHGKIPLLPPGGYDFIDVRDVAASIVSALEHGQSGQIYLLSGQYHSMKELAKRIHDVSGVRVPSFSLSYAVMKRLLPVVQLYSRITHSAPVYTLESITALSHGHPKMDHSKATRELGHRCRPLEESLRDFYSWQQDHQSVSCL